MLTKEEALADVAAPAKAMMEEKGGTFNHQTHYSGNHGQISRFLLPGRENALSTKVLLEATGLKTSRDLQQAIETERKHGIPILTKPTGGYYLPSENTSEAIRECRQFIHYMDAKGFGCLNSAKAARTYLTQLEQIAAGQQKMEL